MTDDYFFFKDVSYSMDAVFRAMPGNTPAWAWGLIRRKPYPTWLLRSKRRWSRDYNATFEGNYWMLTGEHWTMPPEGPTP